MSRSPSPSVPISSDDDIDYDGMSDFESDPELSTLPVATEDEPKSSSGGYAPKVVSKTKKETKFQVVKIPNEKAYKLTDDEKKALDAFTPEQKKKVTNEMKALISKFLYFKKDNDEATKDATASDTLFSFTVKYQKAEVKLTNLKGKTTMATIRDNVCYNLGFNKGTYKHYDLEFNGRRLTEKPRSTIKTNSLKSGDVLDLV